MKYLLQLERTKSYVAPCGCESHYTDDPKKARQYPTLMQAELCALDNEIVVPRADALRR